MEPEIESTEATQTKESEYEPKPNVANIAEAKPSQQDKKHSSSNSLLLCKLVANTGRLYVSCYDIAIGVGSLGFKFRVGQIDAVSLAAAAAFFGAVLPRRKAT